MTRRHMQSAAAIVRAILAGAWTHEAPSWERDTPVEAIYDTGVWDHDSETNARYTRAVQTAEAFIVLFTQYNPHFDERRFLIACGLAEAPKGKARL